MELYFIYLLFEVGGAGLLYKIFTPYAYSLFSWEADNCGFISSRAVWAALWSNATGCTRISVH
jgi:hypothetical protein